jgi:hypothetical protein
MQTRNELREFQDAVFSKVQNIQSGSQTQPDGSYESPYKKLCYMLLKMTQARTTIGQEELILEKLRFDEMHRRELSIEDAHAKTFRWLVHNPVDDIITSDRATFGDKESGS